MYYIIAIPEAAIGIIVLLLLCLVWTGGLLVSQFWASLLYWVQIPAHPTTHSAKN